MSTRWIASIGVVLCAAMTSFSIYLGAIEPIHRVKTSHSHVASTAPGREDACTTIQLPHNTLTTRGPSVSPCFGNAHVIR